MSFTVKVRSRSDRLVPTKHVICEQFVGTTSTCPVLPKSVC
jgi:hypothetical protein